MVHRCKLYSAKLQDDQWIMNCKYVEVIPSYSGFCLEAKKWTSDLPNKKQPSCPLNGNIWSNAMIMQYIIPREYHLDLHRITRSTITVKIQIFWGVTLYCWVYGLWCFKDSSYLHFRHCIACVWRWRQCVPSKHQQPLTQWQRVTSQETRNFSSSSSSSSSLRPSHLASRITALKKHGECHFVKWVADFSSSFDPWQTQGIASSY